MVEYIDKDKLLNDIECIDISCCTDIDDIFTEVERTIDEQPTANVQEVVRCKDCSYFCKATVNKKGFLICPASGMDITNNDFCSYGAKMDKE